jgi:hypothetical protein
MKHLRGLPGSFVIVLFFSSLLSCGQGAANGIFNLDARNQEDWVGALKYSCRIEYPLVHIPGSPPESPQFSKNEDITVWAMYYDGSSEIVPSSRLSVSIDGTPVYQDPITLNFTGKVTVKVMYGSRSFEYPIYVGISNSGGDSGGDGTIINIVVQ